jgi:hypothetical protein
MIPDSFADFIPDGLAKEITGKKAPDTLFHYTDGGAVIGIVDKKALWATSVQYMNDPHEVHFMISEVVKRCSNKIKDIPTENLHLIPTLDTISNTQHNEEDVKNTILIMLLEYTIDLLNHYSGSGYQICLISLSEEGDLLSQWRAYAPHNGYSIGFNANELKKLPSCQSKDATPEFLVKREADYKLLPCVYKKKEEQTLYASEVIDKTIKFVERNIQEFITDTASIRPLKTTAYDLSARLSNAVIFFSSILKEASFAEEKEWRLVSRPIPYENLSYRPRGSLIVPYDVFSLRGNEPGIRPSIPIGSIYVGPGSEREKRLSEQTLIGFLKKHGVTNPDGSNVSITPTESTFTKSL